jgi:hypothetical protein
VYWLGLITGLAVVGIPLVCLVARYHRLERTAHLLASRVEELEVLGQMKNGQPARKSGRTMWD